MRQGRGGKIPPPSSEETDSNLTIGQTDYTLGAVEERTATVSFTALDEWTLAVVYDDADAETDAEADEWLSVSSENGPAGEQTVELSARMNFGDTDRTARVEITCGEQTAQVTVTQSVSDKTDFTDLFDPDFAKKLEEQEIIPNAQKITRQDMANITAVTELDVSFEALTSLQGIAYFESLTTLDCYDNQLTALDISQNTALEAMECGTNHLTSLDVSKNTALTLLGCYDNQLTKLDVSKNTALEGLYCYENRLESLDVSKNTALTTLWCHTNQLTSLNVSDCTALRWLESYRNQLTSLDVSGCTDLENLSCYGNSLTSLDVSQNTALTMFWCHSNQLTALDVSQNTKLGQLDCKDNPGDGESTFPVTVWDNFDLDNIPSGFTKTDWEYEGNTITPIYKKAE